MTATLPTRRVIPAPRPAPAAEQAPADPVAAVVAFLATRDGDSTRAQRILADPRRGCGCAHLPAPCPACASVLALAAVAADGAVPMPAPRPRPVPRRTGAALCTYCAAGLPARCPLHGTRRPPR